MNTSAILNRLECEHKSVDSAARGQGADLGRSTGARPQIGTGRCPPHSPRVDMFGSLRKKARSLVDTARGVPTLAAIIPAELEEIRCSVLRGERAPSTHDLYRRVAPAVIDRWGKLRPTEISPDALRAEMVRERKRARWNTWMCLLALALDHAKSRGWIDSRPSLPKFRLNRRTARVLPDEYPAVLEALDAMLAERGRRAHMPSAIRAIKIVLYTGCRHVEARELQWEGVHFDLRLIECGYRKRQQARYGLCEGALKVLQDTPRVSQWCFPGRDPRCPVSRLQHAWVEARRRAGVSSSVTIHGLRHSWVTAAAAHGSLEQVRTAIGHSSVYMSARYQHLGVRDVLPLVDAVGEVVDGQA